MEGFWSYNEPHSSLIIDSETCKVSLQHLCVHAAIHPTTSMQSFAQSRCTHVIGSVLYKHAQQRKQKSSGSRCITTIQCQSKGL